MFVRCSGRRSQGTCDYQVQKRVSCGLTRHLVTPWVSDACQSSPAFSACSEARLLTSRELNASLRGDREIWWS